jgi:hypothetical protein
MPLCVKGDGGIHKSSSLSYFKNLFLILNYYNLIVAHKNVNSYENLHSGFMIRFSKNFSF